LTLVSKHSKKLGMKEKLTHNLLLEIPLVELSVSLELFNNSNKDYQLVKQLTQKLSITVNSNNALILQFIQLNILKFLKKIFLLMESASWKTLNFLFKLTKQETSNFMEIIWERFWSFLQTRKNKNSLKNKTSQLITEQWLQKLLRDFSKQQKLENLTLQTYFYASTRQIKLHWSYMKLSKFWRMHMQTKMSLRL